jgi:hypothetical protein
MNTHVALQLEIYSFHIKREVFHNPREIEPKHRRSYKLNRKHPDSHSRKSSTSYEAKMPKIVKSFLSTEKAKLKTIYNPNKGSPEVIKNHEDSDNSKSKSSSKMSLWGSPDLSPEIQKLLNAMNICSNSKSLIISINLCNIKR